MSAKRIKRIIVHWSVTPKHFGVKDIRRMHLARGFRDIGYHRVILYPSSSPGQTQKPINWYDLVKQGRDLDLDGYIQENEIAAAAIGFNSDSVMICIIGSPDYLLHPLQEKALWNTLDVLTKRFGLTRKQVFGHRDVNATQCPGNLIYSVIKKYRSFIR